MSSILGQISPVTVSTEEALGSDHDALLFSVYPSDNPALIPSPGLLGYQADNEQWTE
jgi:hypothetical protein